MLLVLLNIPLKNQCPPPFPARVSNHISIARNDVQRCKTVASFCALVFCAIQSFLSIDSQFLLLEKFTLLIFLGYCIIPLLHYCTWVLLNILLKNCAPPPSIPGPTSPTLSPIPGIKMRPIIGQSFN